ERVAGMLDVARWQEVEALAQRLPGRCGESGWVAPVVSGFWLDAARAACGASRKRWSAATVDAGLVVAVQNPGWDQLTSEAGAASNLPTAGVSEGQFNLILEEVGQGPMARINAADTATLRHEAFAAVRAAWPD